MQNAQTFNCPVSSPFVCSLNAGSDPIEGLTIVNTSNGTVSVYVGGQSPTGNPSLVIQAAQQVALPIASASFVCLVFGGTSGSVYVHWQDESLVALSSAVEVANPSIYPFIATYNPLQTSTKFSDSTSVGSRDYNSIAFALNTYYESGVPETVSGQDYYVESVAVSGLPDYAMWALLANSVFFVGGIVAGYGSGQIVFDSPFPFLPYGQGPLYIEFLNVDDAVTTATSVPYSVTLLGYIQ